MVKNCQGVCGAEPKFAGVEAEVSFLLQVLLNFANIRLVAVDNDGYVFIAPHIVLEPEEQKIEDGALLDSDVEGRQEFVLAVEARGGSRAHEYNGN